MLCSLLLCLLLVSLPDAICRPMKGQSSSQSSWDTADTASRSSGWSRLASAGSRNAATRAVNLLCFGFIDSFGQAWRSMASVAAVKSGHIKNCSEANFLSTWRTTMQFATQLKPNIITSNLQIVQLYVWPATATWTFFWELSHDLAPPAVLMATVCAEMSSDWKANMLMA